MQHHRFLTGALFASSMIAAFSFAACGGNVILDGNTGGNAGGSGGGAGSTASSGGSTTVNPVGGSTGDAGSIASGGAVPACPGNLTYCPDGCVDIQNDATHCGSCDISCGGNAFCQNGMCNEPNCVGCGEYITNGGTVCDGLSQKLYDSLINCVCAGKCVAQCADNVCTGNNVTADCQNCVLDVPTGCGNEFNECSNDF